MYRLRSQIARNRKTLVIILGIILALLITFKSNELFSENPQVTQRQEIVLPEVADGISTWFKTLKENSQYIYHTYQSIRKSQN